MGFHALRLLAKNPRDVILRHTYYDRPLGRHPLKLEIIMEAIIVKAPGGLDRVQRIQEQPNPGPPGPGALRVRLHASSC